MGKRSLGFDAMCWIWAGKLSLVPWGQLVLLFTGPGSGHGGQVVHWAHAVNGSVKLLQLLANAVKLLWVWCQVAGICLASLAPPLFAWTKDKRVNSNPDDRHLSFNACKPTVVIQIPHTDGAVFAILFIASAPWVQYHWAKPSSSNMCTVQWKHVLPHGAFWWFCWLFQLWFASIYMISANTEQ